MITYMGIWIDRRKAYIISLQRKLPAEYDYKQHTEIIHSEVEPRVRLSGGARTRKTPWGPQDVSVDSKSEARRQLQLRRYFEQIIARIRTADRILIMGPGDTKLQLRKEMEKDGELAARIGLVETVDKLTPKQIAARVRGFFDIHYHTEASGV